MLTTKQHWDTFKLMNETADLAGFDFAIDEFYSEGMPEDTKGKQLLLMRRKNTGEVCSYHELSPDGIQMQCILNGVLMAFSGMQTYMMSEAQKVVQQLGIQAMAPKNQLESK